MKRQGLQVTIKELKELVLELEESNLDEDFSKENINFQINIINKKGLSDTWEIEKK